MLLLVAVISVIAGTALEKLRLATRLGTNTVAISQARAYSAAGETLAIMRITDLLGRDPAHVTLAGGWSGRAIPLPVPGGIAIARVTDGGNCFNLNGLVTKTAQGAYAAYTPARLQFARLMRLLGVRGSPDAIAAATSDWIDSDSAPLTGGAEDNAYTGQATPYRPPNTLMADPSELRAVTGVTPEIYAKLRPWICALPDAHPAKINVNTLAPEQAPLLAMLFPDTMTVEGARASLLARPAQGYESTAAFFKLPALSGLTVAPDAQAQTAVTTTWFDLGVEVSLGGARIEQQSLIDARHLPARLVSRQWGEPG